MRHVLLSLLAAGGLAALVAQRRCGTPVPVAAKELWGPARDSWTGRNVEVRGELKVFSPGAADQHYALEEDGFRVGLRGGTPAPASLVGRRVRARGVFVFSEKGGGALDAPSLEPVP